MLSVSWELLCLFFGPDFQAVLFLWVQTETYKHNVTCLPPFAKFPVFFVSLRCHALFLTAGSLSLSVPRSQGEVCPFFYISD